MIHIFKRKCWELVNGKYKPFNGRKTHVRYVDNEEIAREICMSHNNERKTKADPFCEFETC